MVEPVRRLTRPEGGWQRDDLLSREWLVTNGLGAYASGTVAGGSTRSYHGLLTAALPAPIGRLTMLKQLSERIAIPGGPDIALNEDMVALDEPLPPSVQRLAEFRLESGLPVWTYDLGGSMLEKRVYMPQRQNTVYVVYRLTGGTGPVTLMMRPWITFRTHDNPMHGGATRNYRLNVLDDRYEVSADRDLPSLKLVLPGVRERLVVDGGSQRDIYLRVEADRGYQASDPLWSPGYFMVDLAPGQSAAVVASSEAWNAVLALDPDEALGFECERRRRLIALGAPAVRESPAAELLLAADQFLVTPAGRVRDGIRARAQGDRLRSVMAGYHWFADWGRDTMISLEGLTLTTGRPQEAAWILRTFQHYVRDGLLPNFFPEGRSEGLYHTADATMWFYHALDRYVTATGDRTTLRLMLPTMHDIMAHHMAGTRYGIGMDPADGLLRQGADGYQLTWMDAKVDDWVVTPRRGKAVEINALWFNALQLLAGWTETEDDDKPKAAALRAAAERARASFNARFWNPATGYLFDVIDGPQGDDPSCRPNQLFAFSLPNPVLDRSRWEPVLSVVTAKLLTPRGLRSLAPDHPDYKHKYFGDLRARDAAYHQGTVWGWLVGPYIDAWLAVHPDDTAGARRCLEGFLPHLDEACIGTISEVFDAEAPYTPRGCVAQAWSVAEVLRCWVKTAGQAVRRADGQEAAQLQRVSKKAAGALKDSASR